MGQGKSEQRDGMRIDGQGWPIASHRRLDDRPGTPYRAYLRLPVIPAKGSRS